MRPLAKTLHIVQIVLTIFLALSAIAGGIQLLEGTYAPSVELLQGSPFTNYTVPGLALGLIVGGSAALAAVLLIRKNKFAIFSAAASGVIIMVFEFVEVMIIGSPEGPALALQILYFSIGTLIVIVSFGTWFLDLLTSPRK